MNPIVIGTVASASVSLALLMGATLGPRQGAMPPTPAPLVRSQIVGAADGDTRRQAVMLTGAVHARVEAAMGFRVGGRIVAREVDAGAAVRRGDVLFRLDPADLDLAARAATARVAAAAAEARRAAADEGRLGRLVASGAVSVSAYDAALSAGRAAAAQLTAALADRQEALLRRDYAVLRADADGVVTEVLAEPGQVVAEGAPVLRLARAGAREAEIVVPETLRPRLPAEAQARLMSGETVRATLRQVSGAADPTARTFLARYVLAGAGDGAALGATVSLVLPDARAVAARVPLTALHDGGGGTGVWVIGADGAVHFRAVSVAALEDERAVLAGGVGPGERIVTLGAQLLREGEAVRVADLP